MVELQQSAAGGTRVTKSELSGYNGRPVHVYDSMLVVDYLILKLYNLYNKL